MTDTGSLKILFVVNPQSGSNSKQNPESIISNFFEGLKHSIEFFILEGKNDTDSLQARINSFQPERIVAVGGDGTVSLVAKLILSTSMCLGIIPAGSANGMAKELNVPEDFVQALKIIVSDNVQRCDVIKVNEHVCLHLSDIGMNAQLIKYFEEGTGRGKIGYVKMAFKVLLNKQTMRVKMKTKELDVTRDAFMVVLANASKYGFGAVINPAGDLQDGLFEVVIVRKVAFSEFLKMWFRPNAFDPEKVEIFHASEVAIETSKKVHFQVDGEYLGKVQRIKANMLHAQLNILLPE